MDDSTPEGAEKSIADATAWCVYLLRCSDGTFYTGVTSDVERRLRQHNGEVTGGARYTRGRRPVTLAWSESGHDRASALRREHMVRRLSRQDKEQLLGNG